ncbi:MAG: hypothetical protein M5U22_00780 [Thermoleophilia bacterium]|nr:hypothetical protein [Thermoleophilia bacterium]
MNLGGRIRDLLLSGQGSRGIILAMVLLLLAGLLVATLVFALYARSSRGRLAALTQTRATSARGGRWVLQMVAVGLLALAFVAGNHVLERPSTCAQCHGNEVLFTSVAESPHQGIDCAACHRSRGITWPAQQLVTYVRWTYVHASGGNKEPDPRPGSVDSATCLDCHEEITHITVQRGGIKVRHADFVDRVYGCRDCHNSVSHPGVLRDPTSPTMARCLPCHDGTTASSECDTCHAEDLGRPASLDQQLPKVELTAAQQYDTCYQCHEEQKCTSCHGIRMPHPEDWKDTHMRAGFTKRTVCFRCHYEGDQIFVRSNESCSCHGLLGAQHGGTAWIAEHGLEATGQKVGENAECYLCHGGGFCDKCHPASYKERYNPLPAGYDTYRSSPSQQPRPDGRPQPLWP